MLTDSLISVYDFCSGGNQGIWYQLDDDDPSLIGGQAAEIVYNRTTGEPQYISMARGNITVQSDGNHFTGTLFISHSPCVINDCPVPDLEQEPMFEIPFEGTKLMSYDSTSYSSGSNDSSGAARSILGSVLAVMGVLLTVSSIGY